MEINYFGDAWWVCFYEQVDVSCLYSDCTNLDDACALSIVRFTSGEVLRFQ